MYGMNQCWCNNDLSRLWRLAQSAILEQNSERLQKDGLLLDIWLLEGATSIGVLKDRGDGKSLFSMRRTAESRGLGRVRFTFSPRYLGTSVFPFWVFVGGWVVCFPCLSGCQ